MKILPIILVLFLPVTMHAASVSFVVSDNQVRMGDEFIVDVFIDTEQESVNALEGAVRISDNLSLKEIRYSGSVISWWLTKPDDRAEGVVDFAGVLPGGYQASPEKVGRGNVVTLVLKALQTGVGTINLGDNSLIYLNDGEGTSRPLASRALTITVGETDGSSTKAPAFIDAVPPEAFVPAMLDGAPFGIEGTVLVFEGHDKESGVAAYELAHSFFGFMPHSWLRWESIASPHVIEGGLSTQYLYVRALDGAGNARVVSLLPQNFILHVIVISGSFAVLFFLAIFGYIRHTRSHYKGHS